MLNKRQKQAIATKHRIVVCAMELLKKGSYENITIKEICDKASVSVGAFYHYFQSKEDIVNDIFKIFDIELEEFIDSQEFESISCAIEQMITEYLRKTSESGPGVISPAFRLQMESTEKYILNKQRYFYRKLKDLLEQGLTSGEYKSKLSSEQICDWIFRTSRGVIIDWCLNNGSYDLVEQGCTDIITILNILINNNTD